MKRYAAIGALLLALLPLSVAAQSSEPGSGGLTPPSSWGSTMGMFTVQEIEPTPAELPDIYRPYVCAECWKATRSIPIAYGYGTTLAITMTPAVHYMRSPPVLMQLECFEDFPGANFEWTESNEYGYEVLHQHDTSVTVENWACAAAAHHTIEVTRYGECWCGWRGGPAEPPKFLGDATP